jgi:hypothetical protein
MRNALFALTILIIASCTSLPKVASENLDCRDVFRIQSIDNYWYDIKSFEIEAETDDNVFPRWYDKWKSWLDGYNTVLFNTQLSGSVLSDRHFVL